MSISKDATRASRGKDFLSGRGGKAWPLRNWAVIKKAKGRHETREERAGETLSKKKRRECLISAGKKNEVQLGEILFVGSETPEESIHPAGVRLRPGQPWAERVDTLAQKSRLHKRAHFARCARIQEVAPLN